MTIEILNTANGKACCREIKTTLGVPFCDMHGAETHPLKEVQYVQVTNGDLNASCHLILAGMPLSKAQPATSEANQPAPIKQPTEKNKFCKGWKSSITKATGETLDDGIIEVSDAGVSNSGEVIIHHSRYSGLHRGYTLSFPERIEFQIPLGDGRVAHYNGVLISSRQIQGHFFVTEAGERMQSHHGPTRHAYEDNWTAEGRPP